MIDSYNLFLFLFISVIFSLNLRRLKGWIIKQSFNCPCVNLWNWKDIDINLNKHIIIVTCVI